MKNMTDRLWHLLQSISEDTRVDFAAIGLIAAVATKLPTVGEDLDRAIESVWMMARGGDETRLPLSLETLVECGYLERSERSSSLWGYSYAIASVGAK
jgi:hypothetical protein